MGNLQIECWVLMARPLIRHFDCWALQFGSCVLMARFGLGDTRLGHGLPGISFIQVKSVIGGWEQFPEREQDTFGWGILHMFVVKYSSIRYSPTKRVLFAVHILAAVVWYGEVFYDE